MVENQLPSPQLTPPITPNEIQNRQRRYIRNYNTENNLSQDGYFMDFELLDHMTDSDDEGTIRSDDEEEVDGKKVDEETVCSDNGEEINYDNDVESFDLNVSESEIENGNESEHEYEGDEEYEYEESDEGIQFKETVNEISREVIDSFFGNMDKVEASIVCTIF
ncbi:hypothetical protein RclHR1_03060009 [Rhizophagus clarus]|uniref:Uncharacterized protein n=1 Tax=Rhizophagus clarus TaxID=94130 RepID=A0A2Z6R9P9_9GLOM|nr:hypothetical protein RclHR1_03060009 [Rhizophagus clarus]